MDVYIIMGSDYCESSAVYGVADSEEMAKKMIKVIKSRDDYDGKSDPWWKVEYHKMVVNRIYDGEDII